MKFKRKNKMNRKGITPVIAIVLLLMITVAAAGAAYTWITRMQGGFQKCFEVKSKTKLEVVEGTVTCYAGTNKFELALINSGTYDVNLKPLNIFVRDSSGKVTDLTTSKANVPPKMLYATKPGNYTGLFNLTLGANFKEGTHYSIQLVFPQGLNVEEANMMCGEYQLTVPCIAK